MEVILYRAEPAPAGDAPPAGEGAPAGEGGDGEIVGGPRNPQQIAAQKRLQQTQAQVDEVSIVSIFMRKTTGAEIKNNKF